MAASVASSAGVAGVASASTSASGGAVVRLLKPDGAGHMARVFAAFSVGVLSAATNAAPGAAAGGGGGEAPGEAAAAAAATAVAPFVGRASFEALVAELYAVAAGAGATAPEHPGAAEAPPPPPHLLPPDLAEALSAAFTVRPRRRPLGPAATPRRMRYCRSLAHSTLPSLPLSLHSLSSLRRHSTSRASTRASVRALLTPRPRPTAAPRATAASASATRARRASRGRCFRRCWRRWRRGSARGCPRRRRGSASCGAA